MGILLQLKKNMKYTADEANLEASALLLAVLAIFVHAAVSFIFVFAFMNIIAGLYLARVSQLIGKVQIIKLPDFKQIRPLVKRLLVSFIILLVGAPFALHLIAEACLTDSQPGFKAINLVAPNITIYKIANLITTIRPQEIIAQQAMLQIAEQYLATNPNNNKDKDDFRHQLLIETIERFDAVRAWSANNPKMGVREVKMLIEHHDMLGKNVVYTKAQQVLSDNLKADPYHAYSMIWFSRLQVTQGLNAEAMRTLKLAENHVRTKRDQQLIVVEALRQLAAPKIIADLDDIEKQLSSVRSDSETGTPLILPPNFSENIDARLKAIAAQIQQLQ